MPNLFFKNLPLSKSLLNRALIVKSFFSDFKIKGDSQAEDVIFMKKAIEDFKKGKKEFYCGFSGTALRFLSLRLSREKGEFLLKGEPALLKRPFDQTSKLLSRLSVSFERVKEGFKISSQGWYPQGDFLSLPDHASSQEASAFLLSSFCYPRDLYFSYSRNAVSHSYFQMTLDFVKLLGMDVRNSGEEYFIPKNQTLKLKEYDIEQDKSSLFALASFAFKKGPFVFLDFKEESLQPDNCFPDILKSMGQKVEIKSGQLRLFPCENLKPIDINLKNRPDLFPVLAVLSSFAEGESVFEGIGHQDLKESQRLKKIEELLSKMKRSCEKKGDVFFVEGSQEVCNIEPFEFDVEFDHRLVMAAELAKSQGVPVSVKGISSVKKSFPDFYERLNQIK